MIFQVEARPEELHVIRPRAVPNSLAARANGRVVTAELIPLFFRAELAEVRPADLDAQRDLLTDPIVDAGQCLVSQQRIRELRCADAGGAR